MRPELSNHGWDSLLAGERAPLPLEDVVFATSDDSRLFSRIVQFKR
jgi:hypothetical protein